MVLKLGHFGRKIGNTLEILKCGVGGIGWTNPAKNEGVLRRAKEEMNILKKKKKSVPVTGPVVAQRVGRGTALLFHDHGTRRG